MIPATIITIIRSKISKLVLSCSDRTRPSAHGGFFGLIFDTEDKSADGIIERKDSRTQNQDDQGR